MSVCSADRPNFRLRTAFSGFNFLFNSAQGNLIEQTLAAHLSCTFLHCGNCPHRPEMSQRLSPDRPGRIFIACLSSQAGHNLMDMFETFRQHSLLFKSEMDHPLCFHVPPRHRILGVSTPAQRDRKRYQRNETSTSALLHQIHLLIKKTFPLRPLFGLDSWRATCPLLPDGPRAANCFAGRAALTGMCGAPSGEWRGAHCFRIDLKVTRSMAVAGKDRPPQNSRLHRTKSKSTSNRSSYF